MSKHVTPPAASVCESDHAITLFISYREEKVYCVSLQPVASFSLPSSLSLSASLSPNLPLSLSPLSLSISLSFFLSLHLLLLVSLSLHLSASLSLYVPLCPSPFLHLPLFLSLHLLLFLPLSLRGESIMISHSYSDRLDKVQDSFRISVCPYNHITASSRTRKNKERKGRKRQTRFH